jgi:hypothetical protein
MPDFQAKDRKILIDALCDIPQFGTALERRTLIHQALDGYQFTGEIKQALRFLDWQGGALVVGDYLIRLLEGHQIAPGLPALQVIAEAIEPMAGMAHREALSELRKRLGWISKPTTSVSEPQPDLQAWQGALAVHDTDCWRARPGMDHSVPAMPTRGVFADSFWIVLYGTSRFVVACGWQASFSAALCAAQ